MNEVVSVAIAGQVFWIDRAACETLRVYLETIRRQLAGDEGADEIAADIELRVAELLYAGQSHERQAVSPERVRSVVEQIGYIDPADPDDLDDMMPWNGGAPELPRRSYRDPYGRILAGVCSGLALRFAWPVLLVRLVFVALGVAFGLGVVLYLVCWIALDLSRGRAAALAARGEVPTARRMAAWEPPEPGRVPTLQRWLFLPFVGLGWLGATLGRHLVRRRGFYRAVGRHLVALAVAASALGVGALLLEFATSRFFPWAWTALFTLSALYLLVLVLAVLVREHYLAPPRSRVAPGLKKAALGPALVVVAGLAFVAWVHRVHEFDRTARTLPLDGERLVLAVDDSEPRAPGGTAQVRLRRLQGGAAGDPVRVVVETSSLGVDREHARRSLSAIDYAWAYDDGTLTLPRYWTLADGALNRGQELSVILEVPDGIEVTGPLASRIEPGGARDP